MGNPTPPPSTQIATIPDLPTAETLTGAELLWINQAGLDRSVAAGAVGALGGAGVYLPLTGGALTGNLSVSGSLTVGGLAFGTTPNPGDNSAAFATTAFVDAALAAITGVSSFNTRTGAVTLTLADVTGVGGAAASQFANYLPLAGGAVTGALSVGGALTATTLAPGDSSTNVATTAFVANALLTAGAGKFLPLTGGTLTGPVTHNAALNVSSSNVTTFSGGLELNGTFASGAAQAFALSIDIPTNAFIRINIPTAGSGRGISAFTNNLQRWALYLGDGGAESGSNLGSNFVISGFNDAGVALGNYLVINRNSGNVNCAASLFCYGGMTVYGSPANSNLVMNKVNGSGASNWLTGQTNGSLRWLVGVGDSANETGGNSGSNFPFYRYADNGSTQIDVPLGITRSTGVVTFSQPIVNGSDARQKRDITPISDALALVKQLAGVSYERISRPGKREHGLLAQDVKAVVPEAVEECLEAEEGLYKVGANGEPLLGISYTQLIPLLIEAVKELAAKVEAQAPIGA